MALSDADFQDFRQRLGQDPPHGIPASRITGMWADYTAASQLGKGQPGEVAKVTASDGSSILLAWDSTSSRWVSDPWRAFATQSGPYPSSGTSYAAVAPPGFGSVVTEWIEYKTLANAGFTLQLRNLVLLNAGASSTMFFAAATIGADADGAIATDTTHLTGEVSTTSTSTILKASAWTDIAASVTVNDYLAVIGAIKRSGSNNGNLVTPSTIRARWTYTPS